MKVLLFGASGMVGKAVLLECCDDPRVESILSIGRQPCGVLHPKLTEIQHADFFDFSPLLEPFKGIDTCFFCLGVSAAGKKEADYAHLTYDLTMAAAGVLKQASPNAVFTYVSGAGTDSTEQGKTMWARVKGRTENALLQLFPKSFMFRPAIIVPLRGVHSKTLPYELFYTAFRPLLPKFPKWFPNQTTTSVLLGRAMINVAAGADAPRILETPDINRVGGGRPASCLIFSLRNAPGFFGSIGEQVVDISKIPRDVVCLSFEGSSLCDADLEQMPVYESLRCLDLDSTTITDRGLESVTKHRNLEELWLEATHITDAGIEKLKHLKKLRYLSVMDCELSDEAVVALKQELPGLQIH